MTNATAQLGSLEVNDIAELRRGFEIALLARNRSPKTIKSYLEAIDLFREFVVSAGFPTTVSQINRDHVETFLADQLARWRPKTAQIRYGALRQFFKWCQEEGEITVSPMVNVKPPHVPEGEVPVVNDDDLKALLKVCESAGFDQRRDTAILRLFIDCGLRLAEVTNLTLDDVDFGLHVVGVIGKGRAREASRCRQRRHRRSTATCGCARSTRAPGPPRRFGSERVGRSRQTASLSFSGGAASRPG